MVPFWYLGLAILAQTALAKSPPKATLVSLLVDSNWSSKYLNQSVDYLRPRNPLEVPSKVEGLFILCEAPYPIEWTFYNQRWKYDSIHPAQGVQFVKYRRTAQDLYNTSSYMYYAELVLEGLDNKLTGNYSCSSVSDPGLAVTSQIYYEGNSPPYYLSYGEVETLYFNGFPFTIPCRVSSRRTNTSLIKLSQSNTVLRVLRGKENRLVKYDPSVGFIISGMSGSEGVIGHYRCIIEDSGDDQDVVDYHVVSGSPPPEPKETVGPISKFYYNETLHSFICCSDNKKPPSMAIVFCDQPSICKIKKPVLQQLINSGRRHGKDGGCTAVQVHWTTSGIIRCSGHGVEVSREFFFPLQHYGRRRRRFNLFELRSWARKAYLIGNPIYDWHEAKPDDLMNVHSYAQNETYYVGEMMSFYCEVAQYYFADGLAWTARYADNSTAVLQVKNIYAKPSETDEPLRYAGDDNSLFITIRADLVSVSCHAPIWNTSTWMEKRLEIKTKQPKPPQLDGTSTSKAPHEELYWDVGDENRTLECIIVGEPIPYTIWSFHNHEIPLLQINETTIEIRKVTLESAGEYKCIGQNFAGTFEKTFKVYVEEPTSRDMHAVLKIIWTIVGIGIAVGIFAIALHRYRRGGRLPTFQFYASGSEATTTTTDTSSVIITSANGNANRSNLPSLRDLVGGNGRENTVQEFNNPLSNGLSYGRFQ